MFSSPDSRADMITSDILTSSIQAEDMKTLLISPETPYSFWTLDEVCLARDRSTLFPPLGIITVASYLPDDWDVRLADLNTRALTEEDWEWADLILLTGMLIQRNRVLEMIREAKLRHKTVVVGGPYPSSVPDEVLDAGCDLLVIGEAEDIMPDVLSSIRSGNSSRVIQADSRPDMTESTVPRFDLLDLSAYVTMGVQTSRGCPFNCEFCDIVKLFGRKPRYKTPDQVITELEALYRLGWRRDVFITDDNFVGNKAHARAILEKLIPWSKRRGEPFLFWAQASVNLGNDRELIDMMTEANFNNVFLGLETPDEEVLTKTGKLQNVKHSMAESVITMRDNGLTVVGSFIIGLDDEKAGAGQRISDFVEETAIPMVSLNKLIVTPNTDLWHRLLREGRLKTDLECGDSVLEPLNYVPSRPEEEIENEFVDAWNYLYDHSRYLARTYRYFLAMRPTRSAMGQENENESFPEADSDKPSVRDQLRDLWAFARICLRRGVTKGPADQFWKQLYGMKKHNPSRMLRYIYFLVMGEDMFRVRDAVNRAREK